MIISEIHGKLNFVDFDLAEDSLAKLIPRDITRMEDVLTGNVFGIIKNIDYRVLNRILEKAGIIAFKSKQSFHFWHSYKDGTEPDIIIQNDDMYIVVEAKYLSDFDYGSTKMKPQIVREIEEGRKDAEDKDFYYLAVTNEDNIDWYSKIQKCDEYTEFLNSNYDCLCQITWKSVYEIIKDCINEVDNTSQNFIIDLVEYLNKKGISNPSVAKGERPFQYFFGDDSTELFEVIKRLGKQNVKNKTYDIYLNRLTALDKEELYTKIRAYIDKMISDRKIKILENSLAMEKVPINLLFDRVDKDERKSWFEFIDYLFSCKFVNLNGQSDISARLHFVTGNYIKGPVSLFTYSRKKRHMEFREFR